MGVMQMTLQPNDIHITSSTLTRANQWDHFLARWGYRRSAHRVAPGLYALGAPTPDSPVFVTANYTLSFDALREALAGVDAYILVLDTQGINVWCAAGKGSFGTEELLQRIAATQLASVVRHRKLVLPQLGASGVSAHEVMGRSGFQVEYGPVRAADLPEYLSAGGATAEMRRVRFNVLDRAVLIPVELVYALLPTVAAALVLYWLSGGLAASAAVAAVLAGVLLFPLLLPWLPTRDFSSKGFVLGGASALPFGLAAYAEHPQAAAWLRLAALLTYWLAMPAVTAFLALNFTGSTPITSKSGVKREIFQYVPVMAWLFGAGILLTLGLAVVSWVRG